MTKEEKEAIEKLKWYFKDSKSLDIAKQTDTVLNLIQNQQEEIEYQKEINNTEKDRHNQTEKSLKGQIEKKDKIIDEMAKEMFFENNRNVEMQNFNKYQEIIEYFEKKVEEK